MLSHERKRVIDHVSNVVALENTDQSEPSGKCRLLKFRLIDGALKTRPYLDFGKSRRRYAWLGVNIPEEEPR